MVRSLVLSAVVLSTLAVAASDPPPAPAQAPRTSIKLGLVNTLFQGVPAPLIDLAMRPFRSLLETQTGLTGTPVVVGDGLLLGKQLREDKVQLGVFHGIEFAWARQQHPDLEPVILAVNQHRVLYAHLIVRKNSKATTVADLEGATIAVGAGMREHARLFLERRCVGPGTKMKGFYKEIVSSPDGEEAIEDVIDGKAQATVVDGVTLANFTKDKPGRARLVRTLLQSEPFPAAVIACYKGKFNEADLARFRTGMINARHDRKGRQMLEFLKLTAFEAVPPGYNDLCDNAARAYPIE